MLGNRITPAGAVRRALAVAMAALALAAGLGACGSDSGSSSGGDGGGTESASALAAEGEVLEEVLGRQLGVAAAYPRGMRGMDPRTYILLRRFRAQEVEHADGLVEAARGLDVLVRPRPERIEAGSLRTRADRLRFLYEMEAATIQAELSAINKLEAQNPRAVLVATVANQAQHLAILRRLLGAEPVETVPTPFETGEIPPP